MHISRVIPAAGTSARGLVIAVTAVGALALPGHAFADTPVPASVATSFNWNVQFPDGVTEGGVSADLPSAIALAEIGETLTPQDQSLLVSTLTSEATAAGVSLVATTPAAPAVAPAPAVPAAPQDIPNDGGND